MSADPGKEGNKPPTALAKPKNGTLAAWEKPDYCGPCYGAAAKKGDCCNDCNAVREAYRIKGWAFVDPGGVEQCMREGFVTELRSMGEGCHEMLGP